jgi:phosphate transport system permease protein
MADRLLLLGVRGAALLSAALVLLVVGFVLTSAWPALVDVGPLRFLSDPSWHPTRGRFGLGPMIAGSAAVTLGAMVVAGPVGILAAIFRTWFAPPAIGRGFRRLIELLAGVPSVIYGFWGLVVLVPLIGRWQPPGASLLAGIAIVALMIVPTVMLLSDAALSAVPKDDVVAAAALGLSRLGVLRGVVLPGAAPGIATGVLLATARALGETMAVLMVTGNVVQVPGSFFDPMRTLTANIALEMAYAMDVHRSALFVSGFVLIAAVVALVAAADALSQSSLGRSRG